MHPCHRLLTARREESVGNVPRKRTGKIAETLVLPQMLGAIVRFCIHESHYPNMSRRACGRIGITRHILGENDSETKLYSRCPTASEGEIGGRVGGDEDGNGDGEGGRL